MKATASSCSTSLFKTTVEFLLRMLRCVCFYYCITMTKFTAHQMHVISHCETRGTCNLGEWLYVWILTQSKCKELGERWKQVPDRQVWICSYRHWQWIHDLSCLRVCWGLCFRSELGVKDTLSDRWGHPPQPRSIFDFEPGQSTTSEVQSQVKPHTLFNLTCSITTHWNLDGTWT